MRFLFSSLFRTLILETEKQDFFKKVHQVAKLIPSGRVSTYGAIAQYLGVKSSARVVGWAMNAAHGDLSIPAHRVVNRVGLLSGKHHFEGTNLMQQLLESEGVEVKENKVVNFKELFWNPTQILPKHNL
ncbi:MGMT family protein [Wenyingzhuangia sp. IMCC45533]